MRDVVERNAQGRKPIRCLRRNAQVHRREREADRKRDWREGCRRHLEPRDLNQVVEDAVGLPGERDALHGVRQMAVKARKEPEAVLARQIAPPLSATAGDAEAARLAAGYAVLVING